MSTPCPSAPPDMIGVHQERVSIVDHVMIAQSTYRLRFRCPAIAGRIRPGQFMMVRLSTGTDPLLARPFALYDTCDDATGTPCDVEIVYLVIGKMTTRLAELRIGDTLEVWGPLGKAFPVIAGEQPITCVAGGIGQTPFLAYGRQLLGGRGYGGDAAHRHVSDVAIYYGVRTATLAAGIDDFERAGMTVHLATDDGTRGHPGFVTQMMQQAPPRGPIIACGPEPMLRAVSLLASGWNLPCYVSLETPMACGIGICFSCVTRVRLGDGTWDYQRVCVDGPVFDATQLMWSE